MELAGNNDPAMEQAEYDEINMELGEFDDPIIEQTEEETPSRRFGWFYNMNGSSQTDGLLRMATGEEELERLGEIVSWDGEDSTLYPGHCAPVRGSAEGLLPPGLLSSSNFSIWSTDTCRSSSLPSD